MLGRGVRTCGYSWPASFQDWQSTQLQALETALVQARGS